MEFSSVKKICQRYMLKKFKMNEATIITTHMHPSSSLEKDGNGKPLSEKEFRGMIGSFLYLTTSRPDILCAVGLCARCEENFQIHDRYH